ncbi:MAG: hypothetical protein ABIR94_04380 [Rubrivivax sp.]
MPTVQPAALPAGALLHKYVETGAYTDCYCVTVDRPASLPEFIEAFCTTPLFKLERWLLSLTPGLRSTDAQAGELAGGTRENFAAWSVQARQSDQILLAAGRTRSWLMVGTPMDVRGAGHLLFFGSAVVPRRPGGLGWQFTALLGLHRLYSRLLLGAAARRLAGRPS